MSDSLQDEFDGLGDGEFKDRIVDEYGEQLQNQTLMGEELDLSEIGTSMRQYDHGQADDSTVTEYGVRIVFDKNKIKVSELEDGGSVRANIRSLADELITKPVDYVDLSFVTDDSYEVWVVLDADSL